MFLISYFVSWIKDDDADNWVGYFYAILLGLITLISSYMRNLNFFYSSSLGVAMKKGISGVIFKKILRFNEKSKAKATSGKLVAIVSGELQLIERGVILVPGIVTSYITLVFVIILLAFMFAEGALVGLVVSLILIYSLYFLSG